MFARNWLRSCPGPCCPKNCNHCGLQNRSWQNHFIMLKPIRFAKHYQGNIPKPYCTLFCGYCTIRRLGVWIRVKQLRYKTVWDKESSLPLFLFNATMESAIRRWKLRSTLVQLDGLQLSVMFMIGCCDLCRAAAWCPWPKSRRRTWKTWGYNWRQAREKKNN